MSYLSQVSKLNQILILLLVIQIVLGALVFWPSNAASGDSGPLFIDLKAGDVVELTVSDGSDNSVKLVKQGEVWVLPEAGDYPANGENVTSLLEKIEGIQTNRLVTQTDASHKRLQVAGDDFNRLLEVGLAGGSSSELFIGSQAGGNATHVRAGDQSEVYLTGDLNPWDAGAQASNWIDTLYFEVPQADVTKLTLENENGTFEFAKAGESWTMTDLAEDEILNESAVTSLLSQASSVRMSTPLGTEAQAAYGLANPKATVTLQTAAETFTLQIGAQNPDEDNSYVLSASKSPYFVQVAAFTGDNFANKTRTDFLQEPPTPEDDTGTSESQ
jgi:hypothetical protein